MENFTPIASLVGGILIGISTAAMLVLDGKIAGISGIVGGLLTPKEGDTAWRALFVGGLVLGGFGMASAAPDLFRVEITRSLPLFAVAGVLVGYGTRLGSGCTSGHGVCGMSRASGRSIVATLTFMIAGAATVFVVEHLIGGGS